VDGTDGVANFAAGVLAGSQRRANGCLEIARVVERIENSQNIHPASGGAADESIHHVIGETRVLHDILPAQKHAVRCLRRTLFQRSDPLERVLAEITQTRIDRRPAPGFQLIKAERVKVGQGGQHLLRPHPRRGEGLMSVAEHRIGELDAFH